MCPDVVLKSFPNNNRIFFLKELCFFQNSPQWSCLFGPLVYEDFLQRPFKSSPIWSHWRHIQTRAFKLKLIVPHFKFVNKTNSRVHIFFLKMGHFRPLFYFIFVLFSHSSNINWIKCRCCAWNLNPRPQYGWRTRVHWAMPAAKFTGKQKESNNGLVVMGGDCRSKGCEFEFFFTLMWFKTIMLFRKINEKIPGYGPIQTKMSNPLIGMCRNVAFYLPTCQPT